ncbi:CPBP family intramembrane glutamic endopeptidase [Actinocatenispora rupis]|uniref:Peptidase n=1 Tax=Actinocatenispora rupis TaxID=519421 RepID=A0A8J3NER9_9ACTN|nr:CPBP family intramembrane glutamic endopeptidase [Actinocatenispora rupis]GID14195.1 peptidase [Actinocatenispora rupis]
MVKPGLPRLLPYAVVCLLVSWVPWLVLAVQGVDVNHGAAQLVFAVAASGPSLTALVLWLAGDRRRARMRGKLVGVWPVAALGLGAAAPLLTAVVLHGGDLSYLGRHAATVVAGVGGPLGALAYTMVSGPLSEEFGWRGYLQPRLRDRFGRTATVAVLGAAWGLWHVPLFFLVGTGQHDKGLFTVQGLLFFVMIFPITYLALYVSERLRGGVWAAVLLHAAWNFTDAVVPDDGVRGAAVETVLLLAVAALAALTWRRPAPRPVTVPAAST